MLQEACLNCVIRSAAMCTDSIITSWIIIALILSTKIVRTLYSSAVPFMRFKL